MKVWILKACSDTECGIESEIVGVYKTKEGAEHRHSLLKAALLVERGRGVFHTGDGWWIEELDVEQ